MWMWHRIQIGTSHQPTEGQSIQPHKGIIRLSSSVVIGVDIVPITGENRILMYFGLQVLNENPSVGIKALLGVEKK